MSFHKFLSILAIPQGASKSARKHWTQVSGHNIGTAGVVSEWSKEHDWKSCVGQLTVGSNPTRSASLFFNERLRV